MMSISIGNSYKAKSRPQKRSGLFYVYSCVFQHPFDEVERQTDHIVIVAAYLFDEVFACVALYRIPSGFVVPFGLVSVVCIPYTPARFNQRP